MTRSIATKLALIVGLIALPATALAGGNATLHGTWSAVSASRAGKPMPMPKGMVMTVKFMPGSYQFSMTMGKHSDSETGTWNSVGNKLHTTSTKKGKTKKEVLAYVIKGNKLMVTNKGVEMTFVRLPGK